MRFRIVAIAHGVAIGAAVFALDAAHAPANAQAEPPALSVLIELAQNDAADDILSFPGAQLADIVAGGTDAERLALIAALPASAVDALLVSMLQAGASDAAIASVIEAAIVNNPEDAGRVVDVVLQNAAPADRPGIAAALVGEIESLLSDDALAAGDALEGLALAALTLDVGSAQQLAALGSTLGAEAAGALSAALAQISLTADDAVASAIETAVALEGGQFAQDFGAARDEVDVAVIPPADPTPAPVAPDTPVTPAAPIGGPGAAPAGAPASAAGEGATFAQAGGASGGAAIGGGPTSTPPPSSVDDDDDDDDAPVTPPPPAPDPSPVD